MHTWLLIQYCSLLISWIAAVLDIATSPVAYKTPFMRKTSPVEKVRVARVEI
jgi:hypothetical protein